MEKVIHKSKSFDFFISYAGPDLVYAETLRNTLQPTALIFLAPESELLGEDWPTRLPKAIRDAWVTLAIISRSTLRRTSKWKKYYLPYRSPVPASTPWCRSAWQCTEKYRHFLSD
ncbi:MAG: toll/interleukin-1 receptor domain-containing protein [Pseudonocardiaceae bacterium]